METPFDNLQYGMVAIILDNEQPSSLKDIAHLLMNFYIVARVLYSDMVEASEKMRLALDRAGHFSQKERDNTESFSWDQMQALVDANTRCQLCYMQFMEHINRTGRALKRKGYVPPLYRRIYFFRNKMIEHWDDYLQFLTGYSNSKGGASLTDTISLQVGKIAIPYSHGNVTAAADRLKLEQDIINEFNAYGVMLPPINVHDRKYSEVIYGALEKIDSELRSYDRRRGTGIPETIVSLLFSYGFPTPIWDMEEYCKTLIAWLKALPINQLARKALEKFS